jgi:hypothetical protein
MTEPNTTDTAAASPAAAAETKEVTVDNHAHPQHNLYEGAKDVARSLGRGAEHIVPHLGEICAALLKAGVTVSPQAQAVARGISAVAAAEEQVQSSGPAETPAPSAE